MTESDRHLRADRSPLRQLLANLFRNAVKHGGTGVTVTVGDLQPGFDVEDDGPDIPPEDRQQVFNPDTSSTRDGTGLGLSIVKQIVDADDWTVRTTDATDGGARFERSVQSVYPSANSTPVISNRAPPAVLSVTRISHPCSLTIS